jgi:hypothetical protein
MTPGPRTRTRRRRVTAPEIDSAQAAAPVEESFTLEPAPEPDPTVVEGTVTVLAEEVQPLTLAPEAQAEDARTDFYFPPLPRSDPRTRRQTGHAGDFGTRARQAAAQGAQSAGRGALALLRALARSARWLAALCARGFRRLILPALRAIWHVIVDDPYAPPRERPAQALLQGHVLGVYRYRLYQRIILGILGGVPLSIACLAILYILLTELSYGIDGQLFLVQDLAGALAGVFSSLMLFSLASTRITLHSDGIEYKTMFRAVRSRWEEIGVLKVEYYRRSERWVVGTGRGAWAFLYRSLLGLPKGRQLAKLITIYARLGPTGTPYWLPDLALRSENSAASRAASTGDHEQGKRKQEQAQAQP